MLFWPDRLTSHAAQMDREPELNIIRRAFAKQVMAAGGVRDPRLVRFRPERLAEPFSHRVGFRRGRQAQYQFQRQAEQPEEVDDAGRVEQVAGEAPAWNAPRSDFQFDRRYRLSIPTE